MAIEWITVKHSKTGHTHRVPNRKHILEDWAKRGWHRVEENASQPAASGGKTKE